MMELNYTEELLRSTIDSSTDMIQVFKAVRNNAHEIVDFVWILNNKAAVAWYGNVIGQSLLTLNPGVAEEGIFDRFRKVVETGRPDQSIHHYVHEQFNGWFHQSVVKQDDGVATTTRDITAIKQAEQELQQSKALLQDIIDAPAIGIAVYKALRNKEGKIHDFTHEFINKITRDTLGQDFTGKRLTEHGAPGLAQLAKFVAVVECGSTNSYTLNLDINGSIRWISFTNTPIDKDRLVHVWTDITDHKNAEQENLRLKEKIAQAAEENYRKLFNTIDEGFATARLLVDKDKPAELLVLEANPRFEQLLGTSASSLGKMIGHIAPHEAQLWLHAADKAMRTRGAIHFEHFFSAAGRWFDVRISPAGGLDLAMLLSDITERKRAEAALRGSEERLRLFIAASSSMVYRMSADWTRMESLAGNNLLADSPEPIGNWSDKYILPEDQASVWAAITQAINTRSVFDMEHRVRFADGSVGWVHSRAVPLLNEAGGIVEWFGTGTDISERRQMGDALRQREAELRTTLEAAVDYTIINLTPSGMVQNWSRGAQRTFGWTEAEMKGNSADIIFTPEDRAANAPQTERATALRDGFAPDERWHIRKDGTRFYMSGVMRPVYDGDTLRGFVKVARDLTERQEAQEALRLSEERYRAALQSADMAAWDWDAVTDVVIWNDQHYHILGLHPPIEDKDAAFFLSFVHAEDETRVMDALKDAAERTGLYRAEFRIVRRDNGEVRWMSGYGRAIVRDNAGRAMRMVGVMHDITERIRLEQQKEEFIGVASHELRTPVTSIKAYTEILEELFTEKGDEHSAELMRKMIVQVDRLTDLIYALLDSTRITGGKLELQRASFAIDGLLTEVAEAMQPLAGTQQIVLQLSAGIDVFADRERIRQVLVNLTGNAIKYTSGPNTITITSAIDEQEVTISVQDQGVGIHEDDQPLVFGQFFRSQRQTDVSGLGLGLFISAGIIRQHHGRIWVRSSPGEGACFSFTIPLAG